MSLRSRPLLLLWLLFALLARAEEAPPLELHTRMGSGTAWQPEDTPMHGVHRQLGGWTLTTQLFLLYDQQGGPRGAKQGVAPNWFMTMGTRPLGPGDLQARVMLSLDPATMPGRGYPELFQVGETFQGQPLVDTQHPHDFFMEVAGIYTWRLAARTGLQVYAAPAGEPALGPVAFPHRESAADLPVAVLGHHLQDSTHISFGVLTAGLIAGSFKVEGSWFNGHEPDEQRWGFDPIHLNSTSARVSYAPGRHWVFQASRGWLDSPEALEPGQDLTRTTVSALFSRSRPHGSVVAALILGRNEHEGDHQDGIGLEGTTTFADRNHLFGRFERVDRTGLIDVSDPHSPPEVTVEAWTLGAGRDLGSVLSLPVTLGTAFTLYRKPDVLDPVYGNDPVSFYLYLRLRAPRMTMEHGSDHSHHGH